MYSESKKISIYFVFQLLRRILSCHAIANEKHDLSACTNFPDARFQSMLLMMSKIVANLKLVNRKMKKKILWTHFFISDELKIWWIIKEDWLLCV